MLRLRSEENRTLVEIDGEIDTSIAVGELELAGKRSVDLFCLGVATTHAILDLLLTPDSVDARVGRIRLPVSTLHLKDAPWIEQVSASRAKFSETFEITVDLSISRVFLGSYRETWPLAAALSSISELRLLSWSILSSESIRATMGFVTQPSSFSDAIDQTTIILDPIFRHFNVGAARGAAGTLTEAFRFPPEIQSACEQYLLHFADFLRELGVDARVELKEIAHRVMFSVTPSDSLHALESIRVALDAYLGLAGVSELDDTTLKGDRTMVYKLRANIHHLQSQLELEKARSELLIQRAETQGVMIDLLRFKALEMSTQALPSKQLPVEQATEEAIAPYVRVGSIEYVGLKINLAEVIRDLKRLFARETGA